MSHHDQKRASAQAALKSISARPTAMVAGLIAAVCLSASQASFADANAQPAIKARVGSGFGVNGFRGFNSNAQTQWFLDGEALPSMPNSDQIGLGARVLVRLNATANAAVTEGEAEAVFIETALRGPITQAQTASAALRVLGQPITVNGNTVFVNIPGNNVNQLTSGQLLGVFGQIDSNNSFVATRIELRQSAPVWRITGFATTFNAAGNLLTIGSQAISTQGQVLENCANPIPVGQYMEVRANAQANFVAGQTLTTATRIRCGTPFEPGTVGAPGVQDGLISTVVSPTQFTMANLTVNVAPTALVPTPTLFRNGSVDDIDVGVRVEVEGLYSAANTLDARKIRFIYPQVRYEAPLLPANITNAVSITILGQTLKINPQTRDSDGIGANGLPVSRQVRVRGYVDQQGNQFATRIEDRGSPRTDRYRATGPVNTIAAPNFKVFNININTSTSTFVDAANNPITATAFFAALSDGKIAGIEGATYNAVTNTLSGGVVGLEDDEFANRSLITGSVTNAIASGTLTEVALDNIMADGFE